MNINEIIKNINLDQKLNDGPCERCGCSWCEEDNEHYNHLLWTSDKDGKNVCRRCIRKDDDEEDEAEKKKIECHGCHTAFSPTDLNTIGLSVSLCNKCYCQKKLNESYERCAVLKAEHKANLQIIKDKIKGKIRAAQSRNKKIREMLKDEEYSQDPWRNAGVW